MSKASDTTTNLVAQTDHTDAYSNTRRGTPGIRRLSSLVRSEVCDEQKVMALIPLETYLPKDNTLGWCFNFVMLYTYFQPICLCT